MNPKRALAMKRSPSTARSRERRSPLVLVAGAAAAGIVLARAIEYYVGVRLQSDLNTVSSHAHPR